ncbi:MAG: hypothetical protein QM811_07000 [Pirellulales bacterium]
MYFGSVAQATYDVWTATVGGTVEVGDLFNVTIGTKTLSVAATTTVTATTASDIATAFNAVDQSIYLEFAEYTAAVVGSTIVFTALAVGIPGIISVATTEANGSTADTQTFGISHTTTATGPNDASNPINWSTGLVPQATENAYIKDTSVSLLYGLDFIAGTIGAGCTLRVHHTFGGNIGLPSTNPAGYPEYRNQVFKWSLAALYIGEGTAGTGASLIRISSGSTLSGDCIVYQTSGNALDGVAPVHIHATTLTKAQVFGGTVGIGQYLETATVNAIVVKSGTLLLGRNITTANTQTLDSAASITYAAAQTGTLNIVGGSRATTYGAIGTINVYSGSLDLRGSGGTKILVGNNGNASLTNASAAVSLSGGLEFLANAVFTDPRSTLSTSTAIKWTGCDMTTTSVNLGPARTLTTTV